SWGYVELDPVMEPEPAPQVEQEEPAAPARSTPQQPLAAVLSPEQRAEREQRAARAAAARKSAPAKPRRSGPSKKLMGLPPQALALTVKSSSNRRVRRDAVMTLVAQEAPDTPRWVAESVQDADAIVRAAAEEYFARTPSHVAAALAAGGGEL